MQEIARFERLSATQVDELINHFYRDTDMDIEIYPSVLVDEYVCYYPEVPDFPKDHDLEGMNGVKSNFVLIIDHFENAWSSTLDVVFTDDIDALETFRKSRMEDE